MEILRIDANTDGVTTREFTKIVCAWLVAGSDNASALVFDAATQTGDDKFSLKALANDTSTLVKPYYPIKTGISVTLTGTDPVLYLVVE